MSSYEVYRGFRPGQPIVTNFIYTHLRLSFLRFYNERKKQIRFLQRPSLTTKKTGQLCVKEDLFWPVLGPVRSNQVPLGDRGLAVAKLL